MQAEEAMEIFVIPDNVEVVLDETNKINFQLSNIPGHGTVVWYAVTETARDEWCILFDST